VEALEPAHDELAARVTRIAEQSDGGELDWLVTDLFEVERSLGEARRRLHRVGERLRRSS
jgi:hypothetical protein